MLRYSIKRLSVLVREWKTFIIAESDLVLIVEGNHEFSDVDCIIGKSGNRPDLNSYDFYSKFGLEFEYLIDIAFEGEDYFLFFFLLMILDFLPLVVPVFDVPDSFVQTVVDFHSAPWVREE